jgi:sulfotransferase family protein
MPSEMLSRAVNRLSAGKIKWRWWSAPWHSTESPIFVGGCPRTGTTLLYSILTSHSRIYLGLESGLLAGNQDLDHLARRLEVPRSTLEDALSQSYCVPDFIQRVLTGIMKQRGRVRWGDKSPMNVAFVDRLFAWFPNGRFIHVIRDGRDAACSLRTWSMRNGIRETVTHPWSQCVAQWVASTRQGLRWRTDSRYYELKYESLIESPERTIEELLQWLNEPWEPAILDQARLQKVFSHPGVSQAINPQARARWRKDLDAEGREAFRGAGQQLLLELNYAADDDWISAS